MNTEPDPQHPVDFLIETTGEEIHQIENSLKDCLAHTKNYAQKNPVSILLGALAFGVALVCAVAISRKHEPTLRERLVDQPLTDFREAVYAALAPVSDRLHDQYASARRGVESMTGHHGNSWTNQFSRVGRNLKFW
jgi:hypothetical protein